VLQLLQLLMPSRLLRPVVRPLVRFFLGFIAIPIFRIVMRKVARVQEINEELEKDLEHWFRGSLLLLVATANMESFLFDWVSESARDSAWFLAGRLLLAIGVIEGMPDQALFALIHPGPQKPEIERGHVVRSVIRYLPHLLKGLICQHLNRSSPVLAILAVLKDGTVGWVCYGVAIVQYLIIGLVASKDKALDVLTAFDEAVAKHRHGIETELNLSEAARKAAMTNLKTMDPNIESL